MSHRPYAGVGMAMQTIDSFGTQPDVLAHARAAEAAALDHVWVPDHLLFHRPILEAITTLAAIAGATRRVGLGSSVLNGVLRPPVWMAKQLQTLCALAPGRVALGVGVGGEFPPEFEAAGVPLNGRGRRLDDLLADLPGLLGGEGVGLTPAVDAPPVLVGGRSEAALGRVARFGDAWLPMWMDPDRVAAAHAEIAERAKEHGRGAPDVVYLAFVHVSDEPARGREEAAQLAERQYGMAFEKIERWALIGDADEVAGRLRAYRDVGVRGFVLSPATPDPATQIDGIAAVREALA